MSRINYSSVFKNDIEEFLDYKEKCGYKRKSYKIALHNFDKYAKNKANKNELTRDLVEEWLFSDKNEHKVTRSNRGSIIREFAKFLNTIKEKDAYIIDSKLYTVSSTFIPHIYTDEEVDKFFSQIDITVKNNIWIPNNKQQIKLFFKILYCCGLRDSELIRLTYDDINLEEKYLIINNSKNDISRLIYINDDLVNDLRKYKENNICNSKYLFYNYKTKDKRRLPMIRDLFHNIIKDAGFDSNIRYRIHDFRHTFAVKSIKKCYESGKDVYLFLPILMVYMGHSHIRSTEYYLRFTPDIYEKVTNQFKTEFNGVIPKVSDIK